MLHLVVAVLVRLASKIGNFLRRSKRLTVGIERKTVHFEQDEHRLTLQLSPTDFERRCDGHAEDEEPVHGAHHHRE